MGSLHKWFKGSKSVDGEPGWVEVISGEPCAREEDDDEDETPKCVSSDKRASMTKAERISAQRRKSAADPNQSEKSDASKPTYVSTDKPKMNEESDIKGKGSGKKDACYTKVKSRYDVWPSAYASGALVKCRKVGAANWGTKSEAVNLAQQAAIAISMKKKGIKPKEMKEETGEASIVRWSLENQPDKFKEWCFIDENNELQGPLAKRFEQAIRLEGTKSNQSKHAAGIAISAYPLKNICPMVYDSRNEQLIAGMEMQDLESLGIIKFDILGVAMLDKIMSIRDTLLTGE
jgi:hypothetical protein